MLASQELLLLIQQMFNYFLKTYAVVQQKYKLSPDRVLNLEETGITTVLQTPKVISQIGQRQVGQCVSAERGNLVTFCGIISATGVAIPPVYIYPRVRMKDAFMFGSVPGSVGFASKTGWMNSDIFVKVLEHIKKHE
ncbi:hypothetical protein NQ317_011215 [Molorchus minor]|uniref:DDE-1 domain-containing protein n=1 Tax=Molorchus minor TaxID=1323400 RepID=A0ABQ9JH10_9CUCU|nr:hypothetical protein NQ317_011215 [Molorchus minor]